MNFLYLATENSENKKKHHKSKKCTYLLKITSNNLNNFYLVT